MMNQHKNMDVKNGYRRLLRAGAMLTATGAIIALLSGNPAYGQQAPADAGPATRPSMVADGVAGDGSLRLTSGKSTIINLRRMYSRVSIGNSEIADFNKVSATSLLITAKKPGTTAMVIFDDENRSVVIDVIVDPDLAMLERQLKQAFPALDILVTPLNDTIAVRGKVPSTEVAEQIVEMASTYGKVHNFLDICGGQQINLQVRFAEVSKTAMRNLGVTFGGTDGISTFTTNGIGPGANIFTFPPAAGASPLSSLVSGNLYGSGQFAHVSFDYLITAMRTNNLLRTLAEPNLLTSSGAEASFLAGGQIPIPVPQPGNGGTTITIQYVNYGVQLKFTPNVLGNGKIRLRVAPEVSQLDYSHAVLLAGSTDPVPGFTDRKLETTVELGDGQSLALAGLLQNDVSSSVSRIPLLGDLPVLGALFRSTAYTRDETELVVIVTPRLQAPLNPDQVPLLPGEHWRYPTEIQQFFKADLGGPAVEPSKARADTKSVGAPPQFHGSFGFTAAGVGSVKPTDDSDAPAK
jgi:pilus assembly protein CpaC